jgi:hypothetical protein
MVGRSSTASGGKNVGGDEGGQHEFEGKGMLNIVYQGETGSTVVTVGIEGAPLMLLPTESLPRDEVALAVVGSDNTIVEGVAETGAAAVVRELATAEAVGVGLRVDAVDVEGRLLLQALSPSSCM